MGWEDDPLYLADGAHEFHILKTWDEQITGNKLWLAHLLIERMVVDGWDIDVCWSAKTNEIMCVATKCDNGGYIEHRLREADFPTAVVELFCRVYAIPDGE